MIEPLEPELQEAFRHLHDEPEHLASREFIRNLMGGRRVPEDDETPEQTFARNLFHDIND